MSADLLRRAAVKLREHAEAATRGPWLRAADHDVARGQYHDNEVGFWDGPYAEQVTSTGDGDEATADAAYIALMHPPVALALADWLEAVTASGCNPVQMHKALVVARAILREEES